MNKKNKNNTRIKNALKQYAVELDSKFDLLYLTDIVKNQKTRKYMGAR